MWDAYLLGLRGALRRWPVTLGLFLASAMFGIAFGSVSWSWLSLALDNSLATRTLLAHLDMNVFVDLLAHHSESLQMLAAGGVLLLSVSGLVWVWLNAVAIVAVAEAGNWAACAQRALRAYPTFLRLWLIAMVATGAVCGTVAIVGRLSMRWTAERPSEMEGYWILFALLALALVVILFLATVHDHARIQVVATGTGAVRAYCWAVAFVGFRSRLAFPLAFALVATVGGIMLVYHGLAALIPTTSVPGLVLSLVLGELMLVARAFMRVWFFAAQTELQNASDVTAPAP